MAGKYTTAYSWSVTHDSEDGTIVFRENGQEMTTAFSANGLHVKEIAERWTKWTTGRLPIA